MVEEGPAAVANDPPAVDQSRAMTFLLFKASRLSTPKIIASNERGTKPGAKP